MKTCINPKLYHLFLEKMVIGLEEPVLVKGVGELIAKVDSGNSGYNVIHGDDIVFQGDIVSFKTYNKNGDERRVSKKLKDSIKINIGGGHIQERPVVELDVQFGGQDYKKIPFSITDRGDNEHKVLISKDFVGKELDALIDVTKDNIANNNIKVDYVTEGVLSGIKKSIGTAFVHGSTNFQKNVDKSKAFKKALWGEGGTPGANSDTDNSKTEKSALSDKTNEDLVKNVGSLKKIQNNDADLIRKYISKNPVNEIVQEKLDCPTDKEFIAVYKILDFTGGTCGSENADPEFEKRVKAVFKKYKKSTHNISTIVGESADTDSSKENTKNDDIAAVEQHQNPDEMTDEEASAVLSELKERNYSIFYLIGFKKDGNGRSLAEGENIIEASKGSIENWGAKISQSKNWEYSSFIPFANEIGLSIENNRDDAKGFFALVSGKPGARKAEFYTSGSALFGANAEGSIEIDNKLIQEYISLNNEFITLGDDLLKVGDTISLQDIEALIEFCEEHMNNLGEGDK